jgi:hypothetical protein
MKSILCILLSAALAGCATTPETIKEQGTMEQYRLTNAPRPASQCVAQRALEFRHFFFTQILEYQSPESFEVRVQWGGLGLFALARIDPNGLGSNMTIWLSPNWPSNLPPDLGRKMAEGC